MKAKKAVRRLSKVETLLNNVIDQYTQAETGLKTLLDSAKDSVVRAKAIVVPSSSSKTASKTPKSAAVKTQKGGASRLTPEGRKRLSIAAKKRWAAAKRKGVHAVSGRPLSKTA